MAARKGPARSNQTLRNGLLWGRAQMGKYWVRRAERVTPVGIGTSTWFVLHYETRI